MFELNVESNTPLTPLTDVNEIALQFLTHIGYIPKGYNPKTAATDTQDSVPYRLFMDCFARNMKRAWLVEELAAVLKTTKPTIYRHLNKLKAVDILRDRDRAGRYGQERLPHPIRGPEEGVELHRGQRGDGHEQLSPNRGPPPEAY
jgi:DNA-binding transcriptional ArsR family regulator